MPSRNTFSPCAGMMQGRKDRRIRSAGPTRLSPRGCWADRSEDLLARKPGSTAQSRPLVLFADLFALIVFPLVLNLDLPFDTGEVCH
jgi:hypothetical protein